MSDRRRDYGPAGWADGCAKNGGCGCLLVLIGMTTIGVKALRCKGKR